MRMTGWLVVSASFGALFASVGSAAAQEAEVKVKVKEPHERVVVEGRGEPRERVVVEGKEHKEGGEEHERYPVSFPERPITMGAFIVNPTFAFTAGQFTTEGAAGGNTGFAGFALGARFGITNDFEVHAYPVPILLAPSGSAGYGGAGPLVEGLGGPSLGARYRFLKGEFEMGLGADFTIYTNGAKGVVIAPSIPMRLHTTKTTALDVTIALPITAGEALGAEASQTQVGLDVPIAFSADITEPLHVGVNSGIAIEEFSDAKNSFGIPVGVFAGYAIPGHNGPLLDIDPFFRWPALFTPAAAGDKAHAGDIQIGVEVGGFFYL